MRAITVRPPWSWAIAHGGKHTENRSAGFPASYLGPLLIHAGHSWSTRGAADERVLSAWVKGSTNGLVGPLPKPERVGGVRVHPSYAYRNPSSRIQIATVVALCELVDVHPDAGCCRPWGESEYVGFDQQLHRNVAHLVLGKVRPLPDGGVPWRQGRLGLWKPPPELVEDVYDCLGAAMPS